jgi:hypothetical protein
VRIQYTRNRYATTPRNFADIQSTTVKQHRQFVSEPRMFVGALRAQRARSEPVLLCACDSSLYCSALATAVLTVLRNLYCFAFATAVCIVLRLVCTVLRLRQQSLLLCACDSSLYCFALAVCTVLHLQSIMFCTYNLYCFCSLYCSTLAIYTVLHLQSVLRLRQQSVMFCVCDSNLYCFAFATAICITLRLRQ